MAVSWLKQKAFSEGSAINNWSSEPVSISRFSICFSWNQSRIFLCPIRALQCGLQLMRKLRCESSSTWLALMSCILGLRQRSDYWRYVFESGKKNPVSIVKHLYLFEIRMTCSVFIQKEFISHFKFISSKSIDLGPVYMELGDPRWVR